MALVPAIYFQFSVLCMDLFFFSFSPSQHHSPSVSINVCRSFKQRISVTTQQLQGTRGISACPWCVSFLSLFFRSLLIIITIRTCTENDNETTGTTTTTIGTIIYENGARELLLFLQVLIIVFKQTTLKKTTQGTMNHTEKAQETDNVSQAGR